MEKQKTKQKIIFPPVLRASAAQHLASDLPLRILIITCRRKGEKIVFKLFFFLEIMQHFFNGCSLKTPILFAG